VGSVPAVAVLTNTNAIVDNASGEVSVVIFGVVKVIAVRGGEENVWLKAHGVYVGFDIFVAQRKRARQC
jgi:hypothetical protein